MKNLYLKSKESGVALLMSLVILALLSIVAAAFATNMRLMEMMSRDFVYEMQARYLAEGGIEYAIAMLKDDARNNFVYNSNVTVNDQAGLINGEGSIVNVQITDSASKVDINYADRDLLRTVMGISTEDADSIKNQRNGLDNNPGVAGLDDDNDGVTDEADELGAAGSDDVPFLTPKSIAIVSGIGQTTYENNKDFITTWGYCDPNTQDQTGNNTPRPSVNIHTADPNLISKLVKGISGVGDATAESFKAAIDGVEFNSWTEFNNVIGDVGSSDKIMDNSNPNRLKPNWNSNKGSTEFCFHSGGRYEVQATGIITQGGQQVASKTINAAVRIFDMWNQTTEEQFQGDVKIEGDPNNFEGDDDGFSIDFNADGDFDDEPLYGRVTWRDSCPVNMDECYSPAFISGLAKTVPGSLKMGFWDDFRNEGYTYSQWRCHVGGSGGGFALGGDYKLYGGYVKVTGSDPPKPTSQPNFSLVEPNVTEVADVKRWKWWDHTIWVAITDLVQEQSGLRPIGSDVVRICIKNNLGYVDSSILHINPQRHARFIREKYDGEGVLFESDPFYPDLQLNSAGFPGKPAYFQFWKSETSAPSSGKINVKPHIKDSLITVEPLPIYVNYKITSMANSTTGAISYGGTFKKASANFPTYWQGLDEDPFIINESFTTEGADRPEGILKIYAPTLEKYSGFRVKDVRVMADNGFYESIQKSIDEDGVAGPDTIELGSVWGTKTIPKKQDGVTDAADPANNRIAFQIRAGNGAWYPNVSDSNSDEVPDPASGNIETDLIPTTGGGTGSVNAGTSVQYKAVFTSEAVGGEFKETPVLEDVWLTYLPKAKILYWREQ